MKSILTEILLLLVLMLLTFTNVSAQKYTRTKNGDIQIKGTYNDSIFIAKSKLIVVYEPTSKTLKSTFNAQKLKCGIPVIDSTLSLKPMIVKYSAYIPVDFLTWEHENYSFNIPIEIQCNNKTITGISIMKFKHVTKILPSYNCEVESSFTMNLSDFGIEIPAKLNPEIEIQFAQLLLKIVR